MCVLIQNMNTSVENLTQPYSLEPYWKCMADFCFVFQTASDQ